MNGNRIIQRLYGRRVASRADLIENHIEKHSLDLSIESYIGLGDRAVENCEVSQKLPDPLLDIIGGYFIVVHGTIEHDSKLYGLLRSIRPAKMKDWDKVSIAKGGVRPYSSYSY